AFAERGPAQAAARKAAARGGRVEVERVRVKGSLFWRARVTGISPAAARATCSATRGPCMVLSPGAQ
ncbi:SPOR domain-containing protein, partial [Pseudoroseomonas ludipueritiae]|nr:SPOR domain-containing protein [Pseudoroseomonas ludipueritiae]